MIDEEDERGKEISCNVPDFDTEDGVGMLLVEEICTKQQEEELCKVRAVMSDLDLLKYDEGEGNKTLGKNCRKQAPEKSAFLSNDEKYRKQFEYASDGQAQNTV